MRALEFITGLVIYNPAYTYKFQLKTTMLKKWTLEMSHFWDLVLNHSSNNTVFCLHSFVRVSKNRVSRGLPV